MKNKVVQTFGCNKGAECAKCLRPANESKLNQAINNYQTEGEVLKCEELNCNGPIKPLIHFYG